MIASATRIVLIMQRMSLDWFGPSPLGSREVALVPTGLAGVYVLHTYLAALHSFPVIYAGEAGDLRKRLFQHLSGTRKASLSVIAARSGLFFSLALVRDTGTRARVESALVYLLQPTCNQRQPAADPLLITPPPLRLDLEKTHHGDD